MSIQVNNVWLKSVALISLLALLSACSQQKHETSFLLAKLDIHRINEGKEPIREPEALLAYAAEHATEEDDIREYNRELGKLLIRKGDPVRGYLALENAALYGDRFSRTQLLQGYLNGYYRPGDADLVAQKVLLPIAQENVSISVNFVLASLLDENKIRGTDYKTSTYWLQNASRKGSNRATRLLAERADQAGNIKLAATYYSQIDDRPRIDRALRQARDYYLGRDVKMNTQLGRAWLNEAYRLNKEAAGGLASRIYRETEGEIDGKYLRSIAANAGTPIRLPQSQILANYRAATTDQQRAEIIAPLLRSAQQGDAAAALSVARLYSTTDANPDEAALYFALAYQNGNLDAVPLMIPLLMRAAPGSEAAETLFAAVQNAAFAGNIEAARALSMIYAIGGVRSVDILESRKWLGIAADAGDNKSQYELGVDLYENGSGPQDRERALEYLRAAANQGDSIAASYLSSKLK